MNYICLELTQDTIISFEHGGSDSERIETTADISIAIYTYVDGQHGSTIRHGSMVVHDHKCA
jgi:hypothetical protein